jgi:hypothetical protein
MVRQKTASMGWEPAIMGASYPVAIQDVRPNMVVIVMDYVHKTEE